MTILNDSVSQFRRIAPGLKTFLIIYLAFQFFPIYDLTGSTIQPMIGDLQHRYIHSNLRRILVTLVLIYSYLINDPMLVALMVCFILHKTSINYKAEHRHSD